MEQALNATFERAAPAAARLAANVATVVEGKDEQIRLIVAALVCKGHVLLEDVPGTAKTVLARSLAGSIEGATVSRIQCTPDLQPTDITGLSVWNPNTREFEFRPGPIFASILVVDEVNRALPKAQSALLEGMAEHQVTVDGVTHALPDPFFVVATENTIEQEGTFPLPEAQLDRFLIRTSLGYPTLDEELAIVEAQLHGHPLDDLGPVIGVGELDRACSPPSRRSTSTRCSSGGPSSSSGQRAATTRSRWARRCAAASPSSAWRAPGRSSKGATT